MHPFHLRPHSWLPGFLGGACLSPWGLHLFSELRGHWCGLSMPAGGLGRALRPWPGSTDPFVLLLATTPCPFLHYFIYNLISLSSMCIHASLISCGCPEAGHCFIILCVPFAKLRVWPIEGAKYTASPFLCWVGIAEGLVSLDPGWRKRHCGGWSGHRQTFRGRGRAI